MRVSKPLMLLLLFFAIAVPGRGADIFPKSLLPWESKEAKEEKNRPKDFEEFTTRVDTPLIGEFTRAAGLHTLTLQGVGLVVNLRNTGADPPVSPYRAELLREMRRRGIVGANKILQSTTVALVIVTADLPPLIEKGEKFDIKVRLPDESKATSLNGGYLLETHLFEYAQIEGHGMKKGHELATASGPVLVAIDEGDPEANAGLLKRGRIVAGGTAKRSRDMELYLRKDVGTYRNSRRVEERIGSRFFQYNEHGLMEPLANAKSPSMVKLDLHDKYKDNFPRYLQVIRNIAVRESEVSQRVRMERLKKELMTPATAEISSIRLEAIGHEAVPILRSGLKSDNFEVQFHSALALAYLDAPDGLNVLAQAAREEAAFRVYALAAMSTIDEAECHLLLRDLMNEQSEETRYGAFRTLTVLDPNHPFIRGEDMNEFKLHVLHTEGPEMVHLTRRKKAEVVLFGADQKFITPMAVRAGSQILVTASAGKQEVVVSRHVPGKPMAREVVESGKIDDVVRAAVNLEASFPDVAQMLIEADRQGNLPSRLAIDALPMAGRMYLRPAEDGSEDKSPVGNPNAAPNIFAPEGREEGAPNDEESEKSAAPAESTLANVKDKEANKALKDQDEQKAADESEKAGGLRGLFSFGRSGDK